VLNIVDVLKAFYLKWSNIFWGDDILSR